MIAFYYGLTGFACAIYWRHELTDSVKNFLFIGVAPLIGAVMLFYLLYESALDLADPKASYCGSEVFGLGVPLVIALVFTLGGLLLMVALAAVRARTGEGVLRTPRRSSTCRTRSRSARARSRRWACPRKRPTRG